MKRRLAKQGRPGSVAEPTRLRPTDVVREALACIVARPLRAALTSVSTLLGVAWFVAVLGLVSTTAGQVATTFTPLLATQVRVTQASTGLTAAASPYPSDIERRLDALDGVVAAGVYWQLKLGRPVLVLTQPESASQAGSGPAGGAGSGSGSGSGTGSGTPVIAASPGFLSAAGVKLSQGRLFDSWDQAHAAQVCLVGAAAAQSLGITGLRHQPAIFINDTACVVIGILASAARQPSIAQSVLMPSSAVVAVWGEPDRSAGSRPTVLIQTRPGAALVIARLAPFAISQARPHQFRVTVLAGPVLLSDQVNRTLTDLFTAAGWVSLVIGILAIAAVTLIRVLARMPEYALRRALGARRRHILIHVLTESAIIGLIGALAGASLGLAVVVLVAHVRHWVPVVAPLTVLLAPLAGVAAGLLAALWPAIRAARIQPARALSRSPVA